MLNTLTDAQFTFYQRVLYVADEQKVKVEAVLKEAGCLGEWRAHGTQGGQWVFALNVVADVDRAELELRQADDQ
jgi:hypothetical protein